MKANLKNNMLKTIAKSAMKTAEASESTLSQYLFFEPKAPSKKASK